MEQEKNATDLNHENEVGLIEPQFETEIERVQKKRREAIFEMALFLILGVLIGVTLKTEAVKKITIGFNDYQIQKVSQSYDVTALKKELEEQMAQQQAAQQIQQQVQQQQLESDQQTK
ncbi:MAG: hypothetical protein ACD_56C00045G0005 [uncultured bacterium]|nr:MAG: hypothetical protein ACD_56C00045G0005 [uncultured bacterium]